MSALETLEARFDDLEAIALAKTRRRCLAILEAQAGRGGMLAFLNTPQPAWDGRTGAEILESSPGELLTRLETLDQGGGR